MTEFSPTCGGDIRGTKFRHVGNSRDETFIKSSAPETVPILTDVLDGLAVSEPKLFDRGLTECNKEVHSAIRDDKPSRLSHADSRLLSSSIFLLFETSKPQSEDGGHTSVASAGLADEVELRHWS